MIQNILHKINSLSLFKIALIFLVIGFILFGNNLATNFIGDDTQQIVNNPLVHSLGNLPNDFLANSTFYSGGGQGYYYKPLLLQAYTILYALGGGNGWIFHFFQILLHITNALLLFILFKRFFSKIIALLGSVLFLVHPVNVETIVYISALQDALFFFFGITACLIITSKKRFFWQILGFLCLLLSILSKETGILFFIIIPLYIILFKKRLHYLKIISYELLLFFLYLFLRLNLGHITIFNNSHYALASIPLSERLLNIPKLGAYYLQAFFIPTNLFVYQFWAIKRLTWETFYTPLLICSFFAFLIATLGMFLKKHSLNDFKKYLFFLLWFLLGIILHIQIIPLDETVATRWFYFPEVGLLGLFFVIFTTYSSFRRKNITNVAFFITLFILVTLGVASFFRSTQWSDSLTLYQHDWKYGYYTYTGKTNDYLYFNTMESILGVTYMQHGQENLAEKYLKDAAANSTDSISKATAYNNLGVFFESQGKYNDAKLAFLQAISIGGEYSSFVNYARFSLAHDSPQNTKQFIITALQTYPQNAQLWYDLYLAEKTLGNNEAATTALQNALSFDSGIINHNLPENNLLNNIPLRVE